MVLMQYIPMLMLTSTAVLHLEKRQGAFRTSGQTMLACRKFAKPSSPHRSVRKMRTLSSKCHARLLASSGVAWSGEDWSSLCVFPKR